MSRTQSHESGAGRTLALVVCVLVVLALAPARYSGWVRWIGGLFETVLTPITHPLSGVSRWLSGAGGPGVTPEVQRQLTEERDRFQTLFLQQRDENTRLRDLIAELQRGMKLNPDLPVTQLAAPVVGVSSDLASAVMRVRAGASEGVDTNAVVAAAGLQLLGKVIEVSNRQCLVQPITSKASGGLIGVVMFDDERPGALCRLSPTGDGSLKGDVGESADKKAGWEESVKVGATVRLSDTERWPKNAQYLVVGTIERVDPNPAMPLRPTIVVRPSMRLERVSEVILRLSREAAIEDSKAGGRS
ncbi:MAG: hypothetical protein JNL50_13900 [Phycisphaerae bacterium]|nr:hypothetical protein [Phycisphaerae bacterium]